MICIQHNYCRLTSVMTDIPEKCQLTNQMKMKQLFVNQLMLTVAGSILIVIGLTYGSASAVYTLSGILLTVTGPFILYILHKKTSEIIDYK